MPSRGRLQRPVSRIGQCPRRAVCGKVVDYLRAAISGKGKIVVMDFMKSAFVVGAAMFFALMWGLLIRRHVGSYAAGALAPDYSRILAPEEERRETRYGIYFMGQRFGKTRTVTERNPDRSIDITSDTEIELGQALASTMGVSGTFDIGFSVHVEPLSGLKRLSFTSEKLDLKLRGYRDKGALVMRGSLGDSPIQTSIPFDESRFVTGLFSPMRGLPELNEDAVGESWKFHLVNPLSGSVEKVTATVESSSTVTLDAEETLVFQIVLSTDTNKWESWVAADGEVLLQETPFGLTLRREDIDQSVIRRLMQAGQQKEQDASSGRVPLAKRALRPYNS